MFNQSLQGFGALSRAKLAFVSLIAMSALASLPRAHAQAVWDGGGAGANWSDSANWGATIPASGGTLALQFGGTQQLAPNNDFASFTASSLTFNVGASAFTLGGNAISLAGNITNGSSNLQTINLGMTLMAESVINTGTPGITMGGTIDGNFGITKTSAGTLALNGNNNYTGLTTVSAGVITVGHNKAFGDTTQGTTITAGATIILGSGITVTGETLVLNGSGDASNTGALRAAGGDATWAGNVTLGSGQGNGTVGGARLGATGAGNLTVSGNITDNGNNFDLVIRSTNGVNGKVILEGTANSYRHTYGVVGTLQLGAVNALPTGGMLNLGNASNQGHATLEMNGFDQQVGTLAHTAASTANTMQIRVQNSSGTLSTLTVNNASGNTFGGSINGNIALVKTGAGALTLSDAGGNPTNTYTGLTNINEGSIVISKSSALGTTAAGTVVANNAALVLGGSVVVGAEALSIEGTGVGGNGALRAQSGTSSWAGLITLNNPTEIQVDTGAALTIDVASGNAITGAFNLTLDVAGDLTIADTINTTSGNLTKNGAGTVTLSGGAANTFTGPTVISTGTMILNKSSGNALASTAITVGNNSGGIDILRLGNSNQIIDTAVLTLQGSGATAGIFQLNGKSETVTHIAGTAGSGIIENEGGTPSILTLNSTGTLTLSSLIRDGDGIGTDGSLAIVKNGASVLTFSGANSYTGTTTINTGTIVVTNATGLGAGDGTTATGTTVASGARLEINTGVIIANEVVTIHGSGGDNNGAIRAIGGGTATLNGQLIIGSGVGTGGTRIGAIGANSVLVLGGQITDNGGGFDLVVRTDGSPGGKVVVSGEGNSYGNSYLVVGTIQLAGGDDRLSTTGLLSLGNTSSAGTATVDLNGRNQRIGGLTSLIGASPMSRVLTNTAGTPSVLTIQNATGFNYGADISGDVSLVKSGVGNQTLSGLNTYTGRTTVQTGTLTLTGTATIGSSTWIDVATGSTLHVSGLTGGVLTYSPATGTHPISGSGTITGSLTVGGVGFVSPGVTSDTTDVSKAGDGLGTITVSGNLVFNPTEASTVGTFTLYSGNASDRINIGGGLTLNNFSKLGVTFDPAYQQAWGDTWTLLDWATSLNLNGFDVNSASNLDLPALDNGWSWQISNFTGNGALTVSIAPEPGRAALLLVGVLGFVLRRRRARTLG